MTTSNLNQITVENITAAVNFALEESDIGPDTDLTTRAVDSVDLMLIADEISSLAEESRDGLIPLLITDVSLGATEDQMKRLEGIIGGTDYEPLQTAFARLKLAIESNSEVPYLTPSMTASRIAEVLGGKVSA